MDTITETTSRYEVTARLTEEFGSSMIVTIFEELCNSAYTVKKAQADLAHIVKDNGEKFDNVQHLFYNRSTVDNASDFERAFAQYEVVERLFISNCYLVGIERDEYIKLISIARQGK